MGPANPHTASEVGSPRQVESQHNQGPAMINYQTGCRKSHMSLDHGHYKDYDYLTLVIISTSVATCMYNDDNEIRVNITYTFA